MPEPVWPARVNQYALASSTPESCLYCGPETAGFLTGLEVSLVRSRTRDEWIVQASRLTGNRFGSRSDDNPRLFNWQVIDTEYYADLESLAAGNRLDNRQIGRWLRRQGAVLVSTA